MHHRALAPATPSIAGIPGERAAEPGRSSTRPGDRPGAHPTPRPGMPEASVAVPDEHPSGRTRPARADRRASIAATRLGDARAGEGTLVEFPTGDEPSPATLCSNLARSVVEILAGARPLDQIGRWVSDSVYVHLLRRTMLTVQARTTAAENPLRPRMTIGDPLLAFPVEGVVEAVVMVHQPGRSRAVAIRLERHRARWRASAINVL
nr:Rv3235 family protein [Leifsonia sp. 1010]